MTTGKTIVTSSIELSENEKSSVAGMVKKIGVSPDAIVFHVDSRLLSGIKIQAGDWLIDTSLQTQVQKLAQKLKEV